MKKLKNSVWDFLVLTFPWVAGIISLGQKEKYQRCERGEKERRPPLSSMCSSCTLYKNSVKKQTTTSACHASLRKHTTLCDATTGFPMKWRRRNAPRNSILMTRHYPDLGSASDWLKQISHAVWPIRSHIITSSFHRETSGGVTKC